MEMLSMCRICLSDDILLHSIVNTHLQEMYESLTKMPFIAGDIRPILACNLCWERLENCYELRRTCLQSEELFIQLLRSNVQVNLQIIPDINLSMEDVTIPSVFNNDEVKQENVEVSIEVPKGDDYIQSSDSEDIISLAVVKEEPSDITANDAAVEQFDAALYYECEIPLDIVKKEPVDDDVGVPRLAAQKYCTDTLLNNLKRTDQTMYYVEKQKKESIGAVEDNSIKQNKIVETHDKIEINCDIQLSNSEDIINLTVFKEDKSNITANQAAAEQDDADQLYGGLGLHTECDITLDIVKEEPEDVDTGAPRLAAQKYRKDTLLNNLERTDQTMDTVEKQKTETNRAVEDKPVKKNKIVDTRDKIDINLHNNKQNNSKSNHNDTHKELSEDKKLKLWSCDTCQKCFKRKDNLTRHIRIHTGEKPYVCNVCNKSFNEKRSLYRHIRTHTGEKPYECNVCEKRFSEKKGLDIHMRAHTGERPYECNVCKKRFKEKNKLDIHMRTHTGEKPYECNVCKKRFNVKNSLDTHFRTHSGVKPYECNVCEKSFNQKSKLDIHFRRHTGEKPYQCNVCKKRFYVKSCLDIHMRTHTGEKPYECNICMKGFYVKTRLDMHIRTHTGEKPYQCNVCEKCFHRKSILDVHSLIHTREKPY